MNLRVLPFAQEDLCDYEVVGCAFRTASRLSLEALREPRFVEVPMEPRWKDYDEFPEERPTSLPWRWDTSYWVAIAALEGEARLGGAIVALDTPDMDMLEGRRDIALVYDIRVDARHRGKGVGRALFEAATNWARSEGCAELRVETQDVNVAACRFYAAIGCSLLSLEEGAYPGLDEAKLVWRLDLT